ncbi:hypothetical protein GLOTRDRAFT_96369 [Gloeophyllum trabeum ATCC 11539]|uniref:Uncharacterized protein n=1 Tax=Gloeophyllum trabeum (strain ATCC 11539 / FP-39264 / Madison 617) TaxID=670483 RepID=S7RBN5_GLOTA|nr:uncharacterized protein GLOTRDRAFT_96369 [Gloeophyllum trabeum ATCC 11539]EPQ51655.1 hypothetical protein GLOTRDRAFT_96369 [Gloeophyllum trabeum ATCC 11539]
MFTRFSSLSLLAGLASVCIATPASSAAHLVQRDLPPGLPDACYCSGPGCQYGIISQPYNVTTSKIYAPDGTEQKNTASPGDTVVFSWEPLPCFPNNTLAVGIVAQGSKVGSLYSADNGLAGPVLFNLGGRNESANGTYVFNGIGMTQGGQYQATLFKYNTTTGAATGIIGVDFTWEA